MKTYKSLFWFFLLIAFVISCQKERSFENGFGTPSDGSLQSGATGDCLGSVVGGTYKKDTVLNSTNYVDVKVDVDTIGSYVISTDTINGFYFRATGNFAATGVNTVRLQGSGKPTAEGTNIFTVTYDSTECTFSVTTLPSTGGGTSVFTLAGAPNACTPGTTQGTYTAGVATTAANTATIQVNVTTAGTYSIVTSAVNGVTFSASGTFSATGTQTVILKASGTPTASGSFNIPVTVGTSTCSFSLSVGVGGAPAVFTLNGAPNNCAGATFQGVYAISTPLTSSNTVTLQVNVTTVGTYSITTTAVNGMTFSGSGSFSATGAQTVVLTGSGTPAATGTFPISVTVGTSTCTFSITVAAIDYFPRTTNSNWSYEFDNNSSDTLYRNVISPTKSALGNTYNIFMQNDGTAVDSSGYYRRSGGDYYQYFDIGDLFGLDNSLWGEYIFLKDNVAANTVWRSASFAGTYGGLPILIRAKGTIMQKDVSVTVKGTTYANTIVVKEEYEYSFDAGANWTIADIYSMYYFSRNIGMIKFEPFDTMGSIYLQELTRYQVF